MGTTGREAEPSELVLKRLRASVDPPHPRRGCRRATPRPGHSPAALPSYINRKGFPMESSTWITMILILGLVWGGFGLLLVVAVRKESGRSRE